MSIDRRWFMTGLIASGAAAVVPSSASGALQQAQPEKRTEEASLEHWKSEIDFRYAPHHSQATICFPDDPCKSIVGQAGDLRYQFPKALIVGMEDFGTVVEFSLAGFQDDKIVLQWIEAPGVPIVHTLVDRPAATLELIAFATRREAEGRFDNVLIKVRSKSGTVAVTPKIHIRTCRKLGPGGDYNSPVIVAVDQQTKTPLLVGTIVGTSSGFCMWWEEAGYTIYLPHCDATPERAAEYFVRLPQQGQAASAISENLQECQALLQEARDYWAKWKPFGSTSFNYPGRHGEFASACARNIQQAREVKDGRLVFQVGPTVYRGLWIVDGNFLLEAARYLGYDKEADDGLVAEWSKQVDSGQVIAAGGGEHWKDTAIAMFTLVRQCELKQDWSLFHELKPNLNRAIDFLIGLRNQALKGKSTNGDYGLLAPGFADGGISGVRSEFTNTLWTLAGLRAVSRAGEQQGIPSLARAGQFYKELRAALDQAAKKEMVRHPAGFEYLPMIAHDDPSLNDPNPWNRPRPQTAQWALSHAIFPGLVFDKNDPIVRGHIALLQSCTNEDVPIETGWLWHDSLWNYNASFAAHVYLWAGLRSWAHRTFTGFLNHASPLYCWREEQPLQHALVGQDWGDMPHNWASAECIRYLRHMLALEDGDSLRLFEGITEAELTGSAPYKLQNSPTRFGRINLVLERASTRTWRAQFERASGPTPRSVVIPTRIGSHRFERISNAHSTVNGEGIAIDPEAKTWELFWT
jgi:hypothetical protein